MQAEALTSGRGMTRQAVSDARLLALLEAAVDGIISIDARGRIQTTNPAVERMFGYASGELIGLNVNELMPSPFREAHDGYLARYLATGEKRIIGIGREVVGQRKDGSTFPIDLSVAEARLGDERCFVGIIRDLTERKRAEKELRESQQFTTALLQTIPDALYIYDVVEQRNVYTNRQAAELLGYTPAELLAFGSDVSSQLMHPDDLPRLYQHLQTLQEKTHDRVTEFEFRLRAKDGSWHWFVGRDVVFQRSSTGQVQQILGIGLDISERKKAEEALRESERRLQAFLDNNAVIAWMKDEDGKHVFLSENYQKRFQVRFEDWQGKTDEELRSREIAEQFRRNDRAVLESGHAIEVIEDTVDSQGKHVYWLNHKFPFQDESGRRFIGGLGIDITECKRTEQALQESKQFLEKALTELRAKNEEVRSATQQLWQAAKLASVGELAASIAHELNNPLATVSLRIESVLARTPADDPRRRALEIIEQETTRMGNLVANLLQFARHGKEQISTVDICEELSRAVELVHHHLLKRQIAVVQEIATDTPVIYGDRQKLRQVFLNLLTNASDAMSQGGTLTLRSRRDTLTNGKAAVRIEVADTGMGIQLAHLSKVFDPFFTTKEEGRGTGLGLAICRRVVDEHHGSIHIDSEVGKGTNVIILLPIRNGSNGDHVRGVPAETEVKGDARG
jgi:PAS domain S-box-containing protein